MRKALTIVFGGVAALASAQQINYTYTGGNGSGGLVDYGIVTQANSGQALIGAEGNGDVYGNLNLGTNISGTRRFWHISKRTSAENHALHFYFYNGSAFQGPYVTLSTNGNVGIGTYSPGVKLAIRDNTTTSGSANNYLYSINRQNSDVAALYFGNDGNSDAVIAANAANLRIGKDYGGTFSEYVRINTSGNVGIGTTTPDQLLTVKGIVHAQEVRVDLSVPGPDYVFEKSYKLPTLEEIKTYTDQNNHLPGVPSAAEMEKNGVKLGEMNMLLLKKVEELTLYLVEAKNDWIELKKENQEMKSRLAEIEKIK
jgi:hypothetical protein